MDAGIGEPFDVVWWDPAALRLGAEPPFGLRRQELISKEVEPDVVAEGQRRYIAWRNAREEAVTGAMRPSLAVRTVTQWSASRALDGAPVPAVDVVVVSRAGDGSEVTGDRPAGPRYGTLVHAALATVPLDGDRATIALIVSIQGRIVGATGAEIASAEQVVAAVLDHPLLDAARHAAGRGRLFRETPVTAMRDGSLIEGIVDLAFETDDGMTVLDFKTDRPDGETHAAYARQVALYAEAIAHATGTPARAILVNV
jgi:ATP-dependent exoDNAse (exonuclease V) beta subunit